MGDGWLVTGSATDDDGSTGSAFIRAFDADGGPLWESISQSEFYPGYSGKVVSLSDASVVVATDPNACDVLLPFFSAERRNLNGDTLWSRTFYFSGVTDVAHNAGDSLAFAAYDGVIITDQNGDSLSSFTDQSSYANRIAWDGSDALLTGGWAGQLRRRSLVGTLLAETSVAGTITDLIHWRNHRLVLTNDGWLRSFDQQLNALDSMDLGPGFTTGRMLPIGDELLIAGNVASIRLDTVLAIIGTVIMDPLDEFPDNTFTAFAVHDSVIFMAGPATTAGRPAGLIRTVRTNGDHALHTEDAAIMIESIDSTWYTLQNGLVRPFANVTVRITNNGPGVLDGFTVSHLGFFPWLCGLIGTNRVVADAGLQSGGSMLVHMNGLSFDYAPWSYVVPDRPFCIGVLSPNNLYDRDQSDNQACDTVHIVLGIEDLPSDDPGVMVTNPFAGALDIFFAAPAREPLRATLFDATGRQLAATFIASGSMRFHWDLPDLSDGVQMLRLEGRSTSVMRKLVHQEP